MNKQTLYSLRRKSERDFKTPALLRKFLEELLGENREFPLVAGYENFDPKGNWRIVPISPLRETDKLTIDTYLQGLKSLEKGKGTFKNFILYPGVDSMHYSNWHSPIFCASVRELRNPDISFELHLNLNNSPREDKVGYTAYSDISQSLIEKATRRFTGPNIEYEHYLKE
jgi:hypothetical protein